MTASSGTGAGSLRAQCSTGKMGRGDTTVHIVDGQAAADQATFTTRRFFGRFFGVPRTSERSATENAPIKLIGDETVALETLPRVTNGDCCDESKVIAQEGKSLELGVEGRVGEMEGVKEEIVEEKIIKSERCVPCGLRDDTLPPLQTADAADRLAKPCRRAGPPGFFDNFDNRLFSCTQLESLRRSCMELDEEAYRPDDCAAQLTENQAEISRRCIALTNILRNLSFVPGNESELCRHSGLLAIAGKLLLLRHRHPVRPTPITPAAADSERDRPGRRMIRRTRRKR